MGVVIMKRILILLTVAFFLMACGNTNEFQNTIAKQEEEIEELKQELDKSEGYASILEASLEEEEEEQIEDEISDEDSQEDGKTELSPGTYYFGEDIDPGRYTITFQDDYSGTIIFHGEERFGENFGMRDGYIYDYTFNAQDGEKLEASIPVILFPK